jgi:DNA primase
MLLFKINKNEPVYIFEGIFDAISSGLQNCIALMGAKIPEERLKELKYPVFVLDNDKTGLLNSLEYSKTGYNVFVQPDLYKEKDMNELYLNHKDINISEMIKNNLYSGIMAQIKIQQKM